MKEHTSYVGQPTLWERAGKPSEYKLFLPEHDRELIIPIKREPPLQFYMAGPLFNEDQRRRIEKDAMVVAEYGNIPWIPIIQSDLMLEEFKQKGFEGMEAVYNMNVYGVDTSPVCYVNGDNGGDPTPDGGSVWEGSRAYALGKTILGIRRDPRRVTGSPDIKEQISFIGSLMFDRSLDYLATDDKEFRLCIENLLRAEFP